ncbi:MAG: hypothetical protein Q4E07_00150 [Eubacteriales bacterium]|nr:hypothetical protein [Eubacteriales bacterium]
MIKKIGVVLLIVAMAFGATACKKEEPKATEAPVVTEAPAETTEAAPAN